MAPKLKKVLPIALLLTAGLSACGGGAAPVSNPPVGALAFSAPAEAVESIAPIFRQIADPIPLSEFDAFSQQMIATYGPGTNNNLRLATLDANLPDMNGPNKIYLGYLDDAGQFVAFDPDFAAKWGNPSGLGQLYQNVTPDATLRYSPMGLSDNADDVLRALVPVEQTRHYLNPLYTTTGVQGASANYAAVLPARSVRAGDPFFEEAKFLGIQSGIVQPGANPADLVDGTMSTSGFRNDFFVTTQKTAQTTLHGRTTGITIFNGETAYTDDVVRGFLYNPGVPDLNDPIAIENFLKTRGRFGGLLSPANPTIVDDLTLSGAMPYASLTDDAAAATSRASLVNVSDDFARFDAVASPGVGFATALERLGLVASVLALYHEVHVEANLEMAPAMSQAYQIEREIAELYMSQTGQNPGASANGQGFGDFYSLFVATQIPASLLSGTGLIPPTISPEWAYGWFSRTPQDKRTYENLAYEIAAMSPELTNAQWGYSYAVQEQAARSTIAVYQRLLNGETNPELIARANKMIEKCNEYVENIVTPTKSTIPIGGGSGGPQWGIGGYQSLMDSDKVLLTLSKYLSTQAAQERFEPLPIFAVDYGYSP